MAFCTCELRRNGTFRRKAWRVSWQLSRPTATGSLPSTQSTVSCLECNNAWRTDASYATYLPTFDTRKFVGSAFKQRPGKRPHVSPSQMNMGSRCWAQLGLFLKHGYQPPGIALLVGTGYHAGINENFTQKLTTLKDLATSDIVDASVASFDAAWQDGDPAECKPGEFVPAVKVVREVSAAYAIAQAPDYQPKLVEEEVRLELPGPVDLLGVIDIIDTDQRVTDFKTSARKKSTSGPFHEADRSTQLDVYAAFHNAIYGDLPSSVRLDIITKTTTPQRQLLVSHRDQGDMDVLAARVDSFVGQVESGLFPPTSPDNWVCSPKFCGFWHLCPHVNAERIEKARLRDVD